ncbi:MAG: SAM-dependent methyltransferase [Azoarcus sp.]|jgi:SAM-dependent MidA family methyltransferase|nr:SAM-dependent methyltransferase [Azoarcus sp.]
MSNLPLPHADALAQSARLAALIRNEIIAAGGWISFSRYMGLALYVPYLGYYVGGTEKFGEEGDFVTAPELTPLFGQALAAQVEEIMRASAPEVIEVGAGSGRLAADLLLELERRQCLPERYGILELSAELRARQRETLVCRAPRLVEHVHWLDDLPPAFSGAVVANEVLDAMPLHAIAVRGGAIFERGVALAAAAETFAWADRPAAGALLEAARHLPLPGRDEGGAGEESGYVSEINLAAAAWVAEWGGRLRRGALLLIDYGYPRDEFYAPSRSRGTLMCHYRQRAHEDPFLWPGLVDITGSVDFTAMAEAGFDAGLDVLGYTSQGQFLLNCGVLNCLARREAESSARYARAASAVQHLTMAREMGESFKVLALGRGMEAPLLGFAHGDRTCAL